MGQKTYLMDNNDGQIAHTHSVSAGLDYPGVGPEHAYLKDIRRAVTLVQQMKRRCMHSMSVQVEGIIPALGATHALAYTKTLARSVVPDPNCCHQYVRTGR